MHYYVYIYSDPRKPGSYQYGDLTLSYEPFYVGKGKNNRWKPKEHRWDVRQDTYLMRKIRKIGYNNVVVSCFRFLFVDKEAKNKEKEFIKIIGRADKKNGPLINMTDGGDGVSGLVVSQEHRKKLSEVSKGRVPWIKGKNHTKEVIEEIRAAAKGRKRSKESIRKTAAFHKGKQWRKGHKNSVEHNKILRDVNLGKKHTEESKEKMRQVKLKNPTKYWEGKEGPTKGKKFSKEHKQKIRESNKKTWAKKRELKNVSTV